MKYRFKTKPTKYQKKAAVAAARQGNIAFLMAPGAGKTKAAIDAVCLQHLRGLCHRVAVLGPLDALGVWEDELEIHCPLPYAVDCDGDFTTATGLMFQLMNYEKLSRRYRASASKPYVYPYVNQIQAFNPDVIILDESHRCARPSANRSQALWRMVQRLRRVHGPRPYVYLLTGTPNATGYRALFSQFRIMDEDIFGTSVSDFDESFCVYGTGRRRFSVVSYKNKDILLEKIRTNSVIVPESKVEGLPERTFQNVKTPLPHEAKQIYNELVEEYLAEHEDEVITGANAGAIRIRLLQLTGGFSPEGKLIHDAKLRALKSMCEDLYTFKEPVVVFCRHIKEVGACASVLRKIGFNTSMIYGAIPKDERMVARRAFQAYDGKGAPPAIVSQVRTGSLAITLTRGKEVIFYSLPDGFETYYQCYKRVHRKGQTRTVRIRHIVAPGTVDMKQLRTLREKSTWQAELTGDPRGFLTGSG